MERTGKHVEFLDYLRGISIFVVFLFHCVAFAAGRDQLPWAGWFRDWSMSRSMDILLPATYGWAGVAMFFVVSGFCIHLSFRRGTPGDWRRFYLRRLFRIYPPYLVALLTFAVLCPSTRLPFHSPADWGQIFSHALLLHNFSDKFLFGINPSFWSIAVEAQLYLLYPLLLALVARLGWRQSLWVIGALEIALRAIAGFCGVSGSIDTPCWLSDSPFSYWFSWTLGAVLAEAFLAGGTPLLASSSLALWSSLAVGSFLLKPLAPFSFLLFAIFAAVMVAKILQGWKPEIRLPAWMTEHLRRLGVWSYSFYLLHQPLIATFAHTLDKARLMPAHPVAAFAVCATIYPAIFMISGLFYRFVEVPSVTVGKLCVRQGESKFISLVVS